MKITIPQTTIQSARVASVSIDEVAFTSNVTASKLSVTNGRVTLDPGPVRMEGVTVDHGNAIEISIRVATKTASRTINLQWSTPPVNISLPAGAKPDLQLTVAQASTTNLSTRVGAITGTKLGPIDATGIQATNGTAPPAGFQLTGLGLASATIAGLALPAADLARAVVAQVIGQANIPSLVIDGLELPKGLGGDLDIGKLELTPTLEPKEVSLDLLAVALKLRVTPTLTLKIKRLVLPDITVGLTIGKIALDDVRAAFKASGIEVANIHANDAQVASVSVAP